MANVLVTCDYGTALDYKGKNVYCKEGQKKNKVYFRVECDDFSLMDAIALAKSSSNIVVVEYVGSVDNPKYRALSEQDTMGCYMIRVVECGSDIDESDIEGILEDTPQGVVPVIKLPESFMNLEKIWNLCSRNERLRFCGGTLFSVEGCGLGCCGADILEKKGIKYDTNNLSYCGCCCVLPYLSIDNIQLEVSDKPERSQSSGKSSSGGKKQPKLLFSDLLGGTKVEL